MASSGLSKKLLIRPGFRVLALNAPESYLDTLDPLPEGVALDDTPEGSYDVVHLFVQDQAQLKRDAPAALGSLKPGGILWVSWPKRSSKVPTDISRDAGWEPLLTAGWDRVSSVAIDGVWAGLRFRPLAEIQSRARTYSR